MNRTQNQDNTSPEPRPDTQGEAGWLAGLLSSPARFRAHIAQSVAMVAPRGDSVGYTLTDRAVEALDEPAGFVAVRGWCEICGQALPWVCTWDEPLCSDCVIVVPADNPHGFVVTGPDTTEPTAPVHVVTATDDDTTGRVLRGAATYLERHGWIQGAYYDATSGSFAPPACLVGAIGMVCYGGPVDAPAQHFDDPGFLDFEQAVLHLDRYLLVEDSSESYEFNDARGRQVDDVTRVLRDAAARPADELIDAIRAIDARNAQMATLADLVKPRGIWGEASTTVPPQDDEETNFVDCRYCGAPGGYPYCRSTYGGQLSCAEVVAAEDAELAAQGGDL